MQENIERIWERIEKACIRSGRRKDELSLVAVTKTIAPEGVRQALEAGIREIGENRVQEAQDKISSLRSDFPGARWHMIGHLQRNKVNRAVELFECIQSVDSEKLLGAIDRRAQELGKVQECLVEIKVSEEPSKSGLGLENWDPFMAFSETLKNVRLAGIMTIAPYFEDPEKVRPYFRRAKSILDKNIARFKREGNVPLLSMGMSSDFETAIEEGSNMVRIGTALFGSRPKI